MKLHPETVLQIQIMDYIRFQFPDIEPYCFHFANERKCSIQQGVILKRMGVKPGVSDIFIAVSRGKHKGLWIELKAGKNRITEHQKNFMSLMKEQEYLTVCINGFEDAIAFIKDYLEQ